ncbi:MAG TPA: GtrA family protein [Solirubrobacteraceae bacterium]|nr:GtrA family protein [Solirubrobacteraceae bacterium]
MAEPLALEDSRRRSLRAKLLSPELGLLGQGFRFALAGGLVSLVYVLTTILLADVAGVPFQVALPLGYAIGLATHFTLQRVFVWVHHEEFALPVHHQVGRYLLVAAVQYGLTAASTSFFPGLLGVSTELVYLATVAILVSANFFVFRYGIFHAKGSA